MGAEEDEGEPEPEPTEDVAEAVKSAVQEAVAPLVERVDALEAKPGAEVVADELKELFAQYKPKDPPKPSETAPVIPGAEELVAALQKQLGAQPVGKHPLAGMAGGPGQAEGG